MKFLKIYKTVKDVFVPPKLKWYFGPWWKEGNLPVWRRGASIKLAKYHQMYTPSFTIHYFDGYSDHTWNGKPIKKYSLSQHKPPKGLKFNQPVWIKPIRKKLKKWHLSWIPPIIEFPIWTSFYFFDSDIWWKIKYDDYRYEYPAHITLVFFGLAISVTAIPPQINGITSNDDYWEAILNYRDCKDLKEVHKRMGSWKSFENNSKRFAFNPGFLKEPYKQQLINIQNEKYIS